MNKKINSIVLASAGLVTSLALVLGGCAQNTGTSASKASTDKSSVASTASSSQSSEQSSESGTSKINYSAYQTVLERYQKALHQPIASIDQEQVSSYVSFLDTYNYLYSELASLQYDFNKDGVDELALALKDTKGNYTLIDLYTLDGSNQLVRLADEFRKSGPEIGEKTILIPLEDGTFSLQGRDLFRIYEMKKDRSGLDYVTEGQSNPSESPAVDLTKLSWSKLEGTNTTSEEKQASGKMDIQALAAGDFSSIAGTWQNGNGQTMVFDASGLVDDKMTMSQYGARIENGYYRHGLSPKGGGAGGAGGLFIPAGADASTELATDASDHSRDRLWFGQDLSEVGNPNEFFYKVN